MKIKKQRTLAIFALTIALCATNIAFAVLQTTLNVSGVVNKKGGSWNIYFENVSNITKKGKAVLENPTINGTTTLNFNTTLNLPGDEVSFTVDVKNGGTLEAILSQVDLIGVEDAKAKNITYSAVYSDGSPINENNPLNVNEKETIKITVKYDDVTSISSEDINLSLGLSMIYIQTNSGIQPGGLIEPIIGKNLFYTNSNGTDIGITVQTENNIITLNGTTTKPGNIILSNFTIPNNYVGKTMTCKFELIDGSMDIKQPESGVSFGFSLFNQNNSKYIRNIGVFLGNVQTLQFTEALPETTNEIYNMMFQVFGVGSTFNNAKIRIKLEDGSTATGYIPYNYGDVQSSGKNLFDISKVKSSNYVINNGDGILSVTRSDTFTGVAEL